MTVATQTQFKEALSSKEKFNDFISDYFATHKFLSGSYDDGIYFENYQVHLDSKNGLVITLITGSYTGQAFPIKDTENISVEDFRQLILNKKFADKTTSLSHVFYMSADTIDR